MDYRERVIVPLDVASWALAEKLVERLGPDLRWVKVGLELFSAAGPSAIRRLKKQGLKVMVDLKLHDIPQTVSRATAQLASLGADAITVHAQGGRPMLEAAVAAAHGQGTRLWAVTVLTSLDDQLWGEIGYRDSAADSVRRLARLARASGCDGIVASGEEAKMVRQLTQGGFDIVTPGIRFVGDEPGDQRRTMDPAQALLAGATQLVIGRPITASPDPASRLRQAQEAGL